MEFKIVETYRNHNFIDFLKQLVANVFLFFVAIILFPTLLITNLFKKKNKQENNEIKEEDNKWLEYIKTDKITLYRKFINENNLPDDLDLPEECNDIYPFEIKSVPNLQELENVIFNFTELETEKGIYLISFNKIGSEMSLWNIDKIKDEIKIVTKLKSLWWEMSKVENKIILKGTEKKKDFIIEIEEK